MRHTETLLTCSPTCVRPPCAVWTRATGNPGTRSGSITTGSKRQTAEAEHQTVQHVLEHVGYFDLPKPVQFVISAKLGQMLMGAYFRSIREVTHADEAPPMDVKAVLDAGVETAHYMSMGRFRRALVRKLDKARRKLVSWLTGKKEPDPQLPKGPMPLGGQHLPEGGPSAQTNTDPGKWEEPPLPDNLPKPGNNPEGL
jgi:hypothetical protein